MKECNKNFPDWTERHETAFTKIKEAVVSRECLTTIDFDLMPDHKIFVTTDASDFQSGAVLSFGLSWETARPVAFDSMTFKGAELNYPVHEKEMLAIIRALQKWWSDLVGVPFLIYTDHKTLENFDCQRDLSRRQARWMEFMSQYECKIVYVKGEDNCMADALSRTSFDSEAISEPYPPDNSSWVAVVLVTECSAFCCAHALTDLVMSAPVLTTIASTLTISADEELLNTIWAGYDDDPWCRRLRKAKILPHGVREVDGLLYASERLMVPRVSNVCESLFYLAHNVLGHFGFSKSYGLLRDSFYWPNMR
jgi:hypothetical protein